MICLTRKENEKDILLKNEGIELVEELESGGCKVTYNATVSTHYFVVTDSLEEIDQQINNDKSS